MIASKYITYIVAVMLCVCLMACGFIIYAHNTVETTRVPEYQKRLFGGDIITLDIQVEERDWQSLLENAQAKEWISGTLVVNGEAFNAVGIRTKGNSSLSRGNGERYSLQFKFNKYVKGQTYYGLDAFCVNNMMGDATYMKDYISYDIMKYIGVDTPLTGYASVSVNGNDYGFCVALERYDEAFLDRVYNTSGGELYSVKISMGNRGDFEDRWQDVENSFPGRGQEGRNAQEFSRGAGMGGFGGNGGGSLIYTGDDPADYSSIFENAVIGTVSDKDKERVITAIKNLNNATGLEKYFDVDGILRYFAAHTTVVNLDSYISNMQQNYYIYERGGKIHILPWDYGLAFGGFQSGDATSVVNFPIDTPVSGVSMEDRPLLNVLLEEDEYRERYHGYLREIVEGYFFSGLFEKTVNDTDALINEYVKNDTSAFFTHGQYEEAIAEFIKLGELRAESIDGQLNGTVPSTSAEQNADRAALVDASSVNASALGSMMGGGGMGQGGDRQNAGFGAPGGMADMQLMQQAMEILSNAGGELTGEVKSALLEMGLSEEQIEMFMGMQNGMPGGEMARGGFQGGAENAFPGGNGANARLNQQNGNDPRQGNMVGIPVENERSGMGGAVAGVLMLLLIGAIAFVARPKKDII